jgi:hypothetical protein
VLRYWRAIAATFVAAIVVGSLVRIAALTWVPISKTEYEECFEAARETKNKHPKCKLYETVWERSFSDPTAYYTMWLTFFTGALAALGLGGITLTFMQISLQRTEFNATHRPKLVFREIRLYPKTSSMTAPQFSFIILNIGESPCEIVESRVAGIEDMGDGQVLQPLGTIENRNTIGPIKLVGGQRWPSCRWDVTIPMLALMNGLNRQRSRRDEPPAKRFWFRANVTYRGADGTDRRTSVCRWYDFQSQSFRTDETNEFEYAD